MSKPIITNTTNPIHFEDLDPHRFEDLVRELIYDFRDWRSIEATGRGGNDSGFDIRAYEKVKTEIDKDSDEEETEHYHPMDGNMWMVQGKREKEIGPKRIKDIISGIEELNLPYGYIFATSANVSKNTYDIFRASLHAKGIQEFYLWSRAELEDMLFLPKNDRILFTFFGISFATKRRSRIAEIRSVISIKNKLFKAIGEGPSIERNVLIRDSKDTNYPYQNEYKDFDKKPRWREYRAFCYHALGVWLHNHEYFAYIDTEKKQWDFTKVVDLVHREVQNDEERSKNFKIREQIENIWEFLPRKYKAYLKMDFLVFFEDILVIDDKGDTHYKFPHLYVDFKNKRGPAGLTSYSFEIKEHQIELDKTYKKVTIFPKVYKNLRKFGKIYKDKSALFNDATIAQLLNSFVQQKNLYDVDGRYDFLKQRDVIQIPIKRDIEQREPSLFQVTYRTKTKPEDYYQRNELPAVKHFLEQQIGRAVKCDEDVNVIEVRQVYDWQIKRS